MADTMQLFDIHPEAPGGQLRRRSEPCRLSVLELAREAVRETALSRLDRLATVEDTFLYLPTRDGISSAAGNPDQSIFSGAEWEFTGEWRPSHRKSKKPRKIRVWRLRL
jgi:hypothetical protein